MRLDYGLKELKDEDFLRPAKVMVYYDEELMRITGKYFEEMWVNSGAPFYFILESVFSTYPEIPKRYPPKVLGFTVNDTPPETFDPIKDGDVIRFKIFRLKF